MKELEVDSTNSFINVYQTQQTIYSSYYRKDLKLCITSVIRKYMIIFLSTGTNLGDRIKNLDQANKFISQEIGCILQYSTIYQTAAWGGIVQPDYYNQVLQIETTLAASEVLEKCLYIEQEMGRIRKERWGARVIDIDILFYGNTVIDEKNLTIPHPRLHLRNFVLLPLSELAPDWIHPTFQKDIQTLKKVCEDALEAKPLLAL